jgi:hypothetical protein
MAVVSVRSADAHSPRARAFRVARAPRRLRSQAVCNCRLSVVDFRSRACFGRCAGQGRFHILMPCFCEAFRHAGSRDRVARAPRDCNALASCTWVLCMIDFRRRTPFCRRGSSGRRLAALGVVLGRCCGRACCAPSSTRPRPATPAYDCHVYLTSF